MKISQREARRLRKRVEVLERDAGEQAREIDQGRAAQAGQVVATCRQRSEIAVPGEAQLGQRLLCNGDVAAVAAQVLARVEAAASVGTVPGNRHGGHAASELDRRQNGLRITGVCYTNLGFIAPTYNRLR